jgi:putative tryptophan/tyrosine transport system substrate-binding protein
MCATVMTTSEGSTVAAAVAKLSLVVAVSILAVPLGADAQPARKVHRIGYLGGTSPISAARSIEAFREGLRELGWIEGQNIVIDYRFAEGRFDRLPDLAAELVRLKVDVIAAGATPPPVAAKNATGVIPIVMIMAGDPVGVGLVASLARPGGNVTGISYSVGVENVIKALELLKEAVPKARLVAVLSNPANQAHAHVVRDVKVAALSLGVPLQLLEARGPHEFDGAFAAMAKERVGALLVAPDGIFLLQRARLADLAAKNQLPSMHGQREYVEAGGLMSYGPSPVAAYRRAASFVDKILKGAKPADLPVEQPTKFELVINLRIAKTLGLTIPPSLQLRADQIIE